MAEHPQNQPFTVLPSFIKKPAALSAEGKRIRDAEATNAELKAAAAEVLKQLPRRCRPQR